MDAFLASQSVTLQVPLVVNGAVVTDATAVSYTVANEAGELLVDSTPVTPTDGAVTITIQAMDNDLDGDATRGFREVVVSFTSGGRVHRVFAEYFIEAPEVLTPGLNSALTYGEAMLVAAGMAEIDPFIQAPKNQRVTALQNAYMELSALRFAVGQYESLDLTRITLERFRQLPTSFINQLGAAQVVEASEALNPLSPHKKRQSGLMSETIGESSMMFRPYPVLNVSVSKRSLRLLSNYLSWELRIGRG